MKKVSILLLALGLAVLLSTEAAQAQITWDFTYEGDVDLSDPNNISCWTEVGDGLPADPNTLLCTVTLCTDTVDPNGPIDYMQLDMLDTSIATRYYLAPSAEWTPDFDTGATVVWNTRFYDGFMHNFGPTFGDGNTGFYILYLYSTPDAHFPGYFRIEDATGRHYIGVGPLGIDLSKWHTYWVAITTTQYDFYVNGKKIYSGTPSDGTSNPTVREESEFRMGDFQTSGTYDLKVDIDSVYAFFGGAVGPGEGECGDIAHAYPTGDLSQNCYVDLEDYAILASDWLTDNRP
jgi:hypothetical protein